MTKEQIYFPFSNELQNNIIYLLLTDVNFIKLCRTKIKSEFFTSPIQQNLCDIIFNFYDEFKEPIDGHISDIILELIPEKEHQIYLSYLEQIFNLNPVKGFVIKELDNFIQSRSWEIALVKCVDFLKNKKFDLIEKEIANVLKNKISYADIKNVLEEDLSTFYNLRNEKDYNIIPTGIKALDNIIKGLKRKELTIFIAPLNVGKTWCMIYLGSKALIYGKNVLHITLEMSREEIKARYFMRFAGVSSKIQDEIEIWNGTEKSLITPDTIYNAKKVKKSIETMKKYGGKLFVVDYPDGTLTIDMFEALLNFTELETGKMPDMVIIDGADGMKLNIKTKDEWLALTQLYQGLRKIAIEKNLILVTVSHSNKDSLGHKLITAKDIRGAINKLNIADLAISINQTVEEYQNQQARLFIVRNRTDEKWKQILINQNYKMGHFCVSSELIED